MNYRLNTRVRNVIIASLASLVCPAFVFADSTLQNPTSFTTIAQFIRGALDAVVAIGLPIISLFMVYAGFMYVKARGNPEQLSKAHQNFLYVIIGTILILGAWVLATLIGGTVSQLLAA